MMSKRHEVNAIFQATEARKFDHGMNHGWLSFCNSRTYPKRAISDKNRPKILTNQFHMIDLLVILLKVFIIS